MSFWFRLVWVSGNYEILVLKLGVGLELRYLQIEKKDSSDLAEFVASEAWPFF